MAAAAVSVPDFSTKVVEESLTCYICYELLKEPKDLDCPHVFCLECLKKCAKKMPTIKCPECRYNTVVPHGGIANLKTNLRLETLIASYAKSIDKQKNIPMCPNHDGEQQHFFCVTCNTTVCHVCLVLEHPRPQHEIEELKVATKKRKAEIQTRIQQMQVEVEKAENEEKNLKEMARKMEAATNKAKSDIKRRARQIITKIEVIEKGMLDCIDNNDQQHMKSLLEKQKQLANRRTRLQNACLTTQKEADTAVDNVYVKQHASLIDKIDKLCCKKPRVLHNETSVHDLDSLRFTPSSVEVNSSWFGDVVLYGNKICRLKLTTEFGDFQKAQGVAATQEGLLAVVDAADAREVIIYRNDNGEYKRLSTSKETTNSGGIKTAKKATKSGGNVIRPIAVAATSEGRRFISDDGVVKVFSPEGSYETSWPTSIVASSVTTTPDDMIVIGNRRIIKGVVSVHQPNGELIRTHQTGCQNIADIASNGKQIAFTEGGSNNDKVRAIDFETGQTLWTFDMVRSGGICYEQKSNTLLVAGGEYAGEQVIEQYCCTTGRLISRLASGLYLPFAMTVTHDSKLVVADHKTLKIYNIQ